MTEVYQPYP